MVLPTHKLKLNWKSLHTIRKIVTIRSIQEKKSQLNKLTLMHVSGQGEAFLVLHGNSKEASQGL